MTWKSTALVTGATTLAAWLAAPPLAPTSPPQVAAGRGAPSSAPVTSEIEREADRLAARTRPSTPLAGLERDPFQFGLRRSQASPARRAEFTPPPQVSTPQPEWPAVRLTGIATDMVADVPQRTAIFSGRNGVLLVREGETVLDRYRVTRIDGEAVEITRLEDGLSRQISLKAQAASPEP
jgi:hypothetical protein